MLLKKQQHFQHIYCMLKWIPQLGLIAYALDKTNTDSFFAFVKAPIAAVVIPPQSNELSLKSSWV